MTGSKKGPSRSSNAFYIISGIMLILILGGIIFWRTYKYKLVDKKLDGLVTGKSHGLYQLSYDHLRIDEALGNISAENIELLPDSGVYQTMMQEHRAPDNLFFIRIPKLLISAVQTPKALLNKEISAHLMRIEHAEIEIRMRKKENQHAPDFTRFLGEDLYREILGKLKSINADSIVLDDAHLVLTDSNARKINFSVEGLSLRFAGVEIDSLAQADSSRILFSKELTIQCRQLSVPTKNQVYDLRVSGLEFNSSENRFHTGEIRLKPRLSETDFVRSNKYAKDRLDFTIGGLDIRHINRMALLIHQQLIADSILIDEGNFHIFRDKSQPHDSVDRTHDYPQEVLMRLSFPVCIKSLLLKNSYIEYKEKNDQSDSSGKVAFFHVQARFDNVTNMPEWISQNAYMGLVFHASFLNQTAFNARIRMRLNDRQGHFNLDAFLGPLDAAALNPLLKPMALAELDKGKILGLHYQLIATNLSGTGNLMFTYDGLSIKLLKKDEDKNKYKTKFLPTLAAGFVLKKSNPQDGKLRQGKVNFKRDIHTSIFNMMWKSMFSAIKQVAT